MTKNPPLFKSAAEMEAWVKSNADYYTTCQLKEGKFIRDEHKTMAEAELKAHQILSKEPLARVMIYAVAGTHDTLIKVINNSKPVRFGR